MFANDVPSHTEQLMIRKINRKVVMFESSKFDKSGLKSGGHIRPGPDLAGFRPGSDMISSATLTETRNFAKIEVAQWGLVFWCHRVYVISVVGGLLSAHLMSRRAGVPLEPSWPCSGPLLRLAEKVARKLLPGK